MGCLHCQLHSFTNLESAEELQVFCNCQSIKQHVVLWTDAKAVTNLVHVGEDTEAVDGSRAGRRGEETWREGGTEGGREGGRGGREGGRKEGREGRRVKS